jgi:hypothetical protein
MSLASALIKRVLECEDFDTWTNVRKHYLPDEYHVLFDIISKHSDNYHKLPTLEELKLSVRDAATTDKVYALESVDTEAEPFLLLDYLKNEYAQKEAMFQIDRWIDRSIAFESAEEVVRNIQQIGMDLELKVELIPPEESMQRINLFESEEEMAKRIVLGLNKDFDSMYDFKSTDYILMGGKRGSGKSITCSNLARTVIEKKKKKALYFSIEMEPREVIQRDCSIATQIPFYKIRNRNLNQDDWEKVVRYWASRYEDGYKDVEAYLVHHDFNKFHQAVSRRKLVPHIVDVVYDPSLTLGRIKAEVEKRINEIDPETGETTLGVIIVDYINKVKRVANMSSTDHLDWKEQLGISHAFKTIAQEAKVPLFSPYQTDKDNEARMAKGILDSCDAAFVLNAHDDCITFDVTKMRGADDDVSFTSATTWDTLTIGPNSVEPPVEEEKPKKTSLKTSKKTGENIYDDIDAPF